MIAITVACRAFATAGLGIGTTDAASSVFLGSYDIKRSRAYYKRDSGYYYIINRSHKDSFLPDGIFVFFEVGCQALRVFAFLLLLIMSAQTVATITAMIAHPTIGIQVFPKLPPVNKVTKKNARKAVVYPTAN